MAKRPLTESAFVTDNDGIIIIPKVEEAPWRERIAKLRRDWTVPLSEEGDACGWSSAVLERDLALRRRRGAASSSRRGCGLIVGAAAATEDEQDCRRKEAAASAELAAKSAALQRDLDYCYLEHFYLNVL